MYSINKRDSSIWHKITLQKAKNDNNLKNIMDLWTISGACLFDWTKALCRHLSPLFFAIWSPDGLARISLYNPSAVKVVVVRSGISRRQNTSRHRSSYVTSTLSCKESRQRDGAAPVIHIHGTHQHTELVGNEGGRKASAEMCSKTNDSVSAGPTFKCKHVLWL